MATPLPLGFLALAVASLVLTGLELSWVDPSRDAHAVALLVLVFVVPLQSLSLVFGFLARDPAATAGMGLLAGSWAGYGAVTLRTPSGSNNGALGLLLVAAAVALAVPIAASITGKPPAAAVLVLAATRFALSGAYELTGSTGVQHAAGIVGLVVVVAAMYAALAFELEGVFGHPVLPLGRRDRASGL